MPGIYDLIDDGIDAAATATFGIRALARAIDSVVMFVAFLPAWIVAAIIFAIAAGPDRLRPAASAASGHFLVSSLVGLVALAALALYHSCAEYIGGATIGKLACGLRVVSEDMSPVTLRGAVLRSIAYAWDSFFFGYVAYAARAIVGNVAGLVAASAFLAVIWTVRLAAGV